MAEYKVTTGPNAYSFNDQATGITIVKGEIKELTASQFANRRIKRAITTGHLMVIYDKADGKKYSDKDIDRLNNKLRKLFEKGVEISKAAKNFSLEEVKLVAKLNELEPDPEDTIITLIEAIYESYKEE